LHCWVAPRSGPPHQRAAPAACAGMAVLRQGAPCNTCCCHVRQRTSLREGARLTCWAAQAAAGAAAERAHAAAAESPEAGAAAAAAAVRAREAAARAQRSAAAAQARPDCDPGPQLAVEPMEIVFWTCVRKLSSPCCCISAGACGPASREGSAAPGSPPGAVRVRGTDRVPLLGLAACSQAQGAPRLQGASSSCRSPCRSLRPDSWPTGGG